jgi:hypothetical protein
LEPFNPRFELQAPLFGLLCSPFNVRCPGVLLGLDLRVNLSSLGRSRSPLSSGRLTCHRRDETGETGSPTHSCLRNGDEYSWFRNRLDKPEETL